MTYLFLLLIAIFGMALAKPSILLPGDMLPPCGPGPYARCAHDDFRPNHHLKRECYCPVKTACIHGPFQVGVYNCMPVNGESPVKQSEFQLLRIALPTDEEGRCAGPEHICKKKNYEPCDCPKKGTEQVWDGYVKNFTGKCPKKAVGKKGNPCCRYGHSCN